MAEYIDRERARFECKRFFRGDETAREDCESLLCMLPTADVAPVRRGEWKRDREGRPTCSECAEEPYRNGDYNLPNYCPNCGAKMEG